MATFLLILGGLIVFNFVLLKFSMQSVDTDHKRNKTKSVTNENPSLAKSKSKGIAKAA